MSRMLKLVLLAAFLEMALVTLGAAAWQWASLAGADNLRVARARLLLTPMMAFFPACLGFAVWLTTRQLAQYGRDMPPDTRRYNEITLVATAAIAVGVQAWGACTLLGLLPDNDEVGLRLVEALTGVFFMVTANFAAKTSPPTGKWAPDPAAWTRGMLRVGWVGVAMGLIIIICAATVAVQHMVWIVLAATAVYAGTAIVQHRAMYRKPA